MNEILIVRLSADPLAIIPWLIWSPQENEIIASGELNGSAQLTNLSEKAQGRTLEVLVNAADLSIHELTLQGSAQRAWATVAPMMLEEQLAVDPQDCFVAQLSKQRSQYSLALISDAQMQLWQSWLDDAELSSRRWQIDALCLPTPAENQVTALQLGGQWLLRSSEKQAVAVDHVWLDLALSDLHAQQNSDNDTPQSLFLRYYSPLPALDVEGIELQAEAPELPLALLAKQALKGEHNLLQGAYRPSNPAQQFIHLWRGAAIVAGLCLSLFALNQWQSLRQLDMQIAQHEQALEDVYKRIFPQVSRVRQSQIKRDIRNAAAQLGEQQVPLFFSMMQPISQALSALPNIQADSLRFDHKRGEVRIQAIGKDFQHFEQLRQALAPFESEQGTLNKSEKGVVGTIIVRKAS